MFVSLVLEARTSLRSASRVLELLQTHFQLPLAPPHWTSGRLWLLRLGHYKLNRPKQQADDWVWIIDHTNQIGEEKCLVILGIRLSQLPARGECLRYEDLEPIDVIPTRESNKQIVYEQLESNVAKTGIPRAILRDDGSDLTGGARLFCEQHPETCHLYDIKHKVARLLKNRLERDARWHFFTSRAGQTKCRVQQTELAFLTPPNQRAKARYMNLETLLRWAEKTLAIVDAPTPEVLRHATAQRLQEKFGWLAEYREALLEWRQLLSIAITAEQFVRARGFYHGASYELATELLPLMVDDHTCTLAEQLTDYMKTESSKARQGERLPASTEVLESCFGKYKSLEHDQSRSGLTGLMLTIGAIVSETSSEVIQAAMESSSTKDVLLWCREKLGQTVQSKRKIAYNPA